MPKSDTSVPALTLVPPAPSPNAGYSVVKIAPGNPRSDWTIQAPDGLFLYSLSLDYHFWTRKEAQAYLRDHDLPAELAERRHKEQERQRQQEWATRVHAHALYSDYWTLKCTAEAIAAESKRIDRQIERTNREPTAQALRDVQAHLRDAMLAAHMAAQARWHIIQQSVDGAGEES